MLTIPGYTIIKQVGQGGMATVYYAVQETVNRAVALKVLAPNLVADPVFGKRFLREARISGQLQHPQIVNIYDVSQHDRVFYICMEYLAEGDLKQQIAAGSITTDIALQYTISLAETLHYAHAKGFVHRDIKPANIMFRDDMLPVITDFGIARAMTSLTQVTATGAVLGTPLYMSPEQIQGEQIDGRSDLYSLAVVLFEMLTGQCPYQADTPIAVSMKQLSEGIPRLAAPFDIFQPFFDKALAKRADDRYRDGMAFAAALQALKSKNPDILTARSAGFIRDMRKSDQPSEAGRKRIMVLAFVVLAVIGGMIWGLVSQDNDTGVLPTTTVSSSRDQNSLTQRLDSLLKQARELEQQGALFEPVDKNALTIYLNLLNLKPDYQPAVDGLAKLASRLEQDINTALSQQNFTTAENMLSALTRADAELAKRMERRITLARQKFKEQQQTLETEQKEQAARLRKQQQINQALEVVAVVLAQPQPSLSQLESAQTALQEIFRLEPDHSLGAKRLAGLKAATIKLVNRQLDRKPLSSSELEELEKTIRFTVELFPDNDNKVESLKTRHAQLVQEAKIRQDQLRLLETSFANMRSLQHSNELSLSVIEQIKQQVIELQAYSPQQAAAYQQQLVDAYLQLANKQYNDKQLDAAQKSVQAGLAIFPDNKALLKLEDNIELAKRRQLRPLPAF